MAKKNPNKSVAPKPKNNIVLETLKAKYFELAGQENIGQTPELTLEIDKLEATIREIQKEESVNPS